MPENVNWDAVWQSVTDTWLPMFGWIAVIVIAIIVISIIRKRNNKGLYYPLIISICRTTAKEKSRRTEVLLTHPYDA